MLVYAASSFKHKKNRKPKGEVARKLPSSITTKFSTPRPTYDYTRFRPGYVSHPSLASTSCATGRNSVMDPVSLAKEAPEVREAIIAKSKRIAIAYSKGAYQYVTDDTDAKTIGRKNAV
jgi:hypothetical protein